MQFPIQPAGGYFPNQPVSGPYPGGTYPQPQIFPQQIGYGMPTSYPVQNSPPFMGTPGIMGGQLRGPQMNPYQPQPLLIGNRPMAMGFPQPYRPIHPQQAPISRPSAVNTKIQEDKIHCVICGGDFLVSQKEQHARRHARPKAQEGNGIKKLVRQYKQQYQGPKLRPIVEPEQYNVQYNPNQFVVQQTVNYQTTVQNRIPPQVKQISTSTSQFPGNKSMSIANSQVPVQNAQSNQPQSIQQPQQISFQPQTVRLTNDGEQIVNNPGNIYDAAAERRFRESQLSANQQKEASVVNNSDARFDRGTFISDQPVPAVQPQGNLSYRQTISPINPQISVSNQPRMVSSRQAPDSSISQPQPQPIQMRSTQPIQNRATTQPLQVSTPQPNINQKVQLDQDSEGVKAPYRSTYDRKYDASDYARKSQTGNNLGQVQLQPAVPIVSPYNSQANPSKNMDLSGASNYNQNNPTSIANNSLADSVAQNQRLQSSKPPALQSLQNTPRQTNSNIIDDFDYGRSPDDKIIPRQTRNQKPSQQSQPSSSIQPSQSVDHNYFPFKQDPSLPPVNTGIAPANTSSYTSPGADSVTQPRMTSNVQPVKNAEQIRMSEILKQKDPKYQTAGFEQAQAPSVQNIPAQNQNTLDPYRSNTSYKPAESMQPPQKEYQSTYPQGFQYPDRQTNTQPNPTINSSSQSLQQPYQTIQQPVRQTTQQPVRQTIQQPARQTVQQPSYPKPKLQESFNQSIQPAQPSNQSLQQSSQSVQDPFKDPYREPSQQIQQKIESPLTDMNRLANNSGTSQRIGADVSLTENYQPNNPLQILQPTTTQATTTRKKLPRFVGTEW